MERTNRRLGPIEFEKLKASLITERISADWFRRYGIPLLAVEAYVDPVNTTVIPGPATRRQAGRILDTAVGFKRKEKNVDFSTVLLDGKALRATSSDPNEQKAFLNVFANELGIAIEHKPTSKDGREKLSARDVLRSDINLEGKIVLADAINTGRTMLRELKKKSFVCPHC